MSGQRTRQFVALVLLGLSIVQLAARPGAFDLLGQVAPSALAAGALFLAGSVISTLVAVALVLAPRHFGRPV